ncbi:MAG: peptidoglycan DD-metalloendopeptidase family protein [Actinomycetota bacterium]|nr:peptidoglycan DD-metalloendopeptidase family protein [Actinomycetota bacterium]
MKRLLVVVALTAPFAASTAAAQEPALWLTPPVDAPVAVRFEAPERKWSRGHRGVDFAVASGTAVRAAAEGRVAFTGAVAGSLAVTIDHGPFQTTYSALSRIDVSEGDDVDRGHWIGTSGHAHPGGAAGLHLGVKTGDAYVDPALFFGPVDAASAIHLVPVVDRAFEDVPDVLQPFPLNVGDHTSDCVERRDTSAATGAPNDNVVVVLNGLGSRSDGPTDTDLYRHAIDLLRYPAERVYLFSYAGTDGPRAHEPYGPSATFGDLRVAADKLYDLLAEVGERHPGVDVDLVAHSQGGLVARIFLEQLATTWVPGLPRVDHLVTLATPHTGAPAADVPARMEGSIAGAALNDVLSGLARKTGLFPDPRAEAVEQLSPSSALHGLLAREDVAFGTRVLSLAVPDDVAVPAHRARLEHERSLVLPPAGGFAHSRIVESARAAAVAHDFLARRGPLVPGRVERVGAAPGPVDRAGGEPDLVAGPPPTQGGMKRAPTAPDPPRVE